VRLWQSIVQVYNAFDRVMVVAWRGFWHLACRFWRQVNRFALTPAWRVWRRCAPTVRRVADAVMTGWVTLSDRLPLGIKTAALSLLAAAVGFGIWKAGSAGILQGIGFPEYEIPRLAADITITIHLVTIGRLAVLVMAISLLAALLSPLRLRLTLWGLKASAAGYTLLVGMLLFLVFRAPGLLHMCDPELFSGPARNEVWVTGTVRLLVLLVFAFAYLLVLVRRSTSNYFRRESSPVTMIGDRLWLNLRTHGRDPRYRKALYLALQAHVFVILILPFLLSWSGCRMRPYGVPKGSGVPAVQAMKVVRQQKKVEEQKYVFDMNTAISFYVPKIDESEVFDEVSKLTEQTYTAQEVGRLGAGGGTSGGWPDGMENAKVRFIRLQYGGGSWNQNMGYGADYNMLLVFREITGFNIWHETESIRIPQLKQFPRRRAPPFVYLAGGYEGGISLSRTEINTLREYCLKMGGMIFADNGGGSFDPQFRRAMQQVFPELAMVDIPDDDVIFQAPFGFPNGAPPLWQISGSRAMGIKDRGRWVVFYHQGNMGAAWRDGHSDANRSVVSQAYQMGVNVIAYSFNQYMQINFGGSIPR